MNRVAPVLLGLSLVAAACSSDGRPTVASTTASSVTSAAAPAADEGETSAGPLWLGISIHVEGWREEASNREMFEIHTAGLLMMAEVAADHGAVLNFEFSEVFLDAVAAWDSDVVDRLVALGQGTGIHADVGGRGNPTLDQLVIPLRRMRDKAMALGIDAGHGSGICSRGPWVEAAIAAGFTSTNGAVEFCATSLDPGAVPAGWDLSGCTTPAVCHGSLPVGPELAIHPYLVDSAGDFLTPADSGLVLMIGESGEAVDCAAEGTGGGRCEGTAEDLPFAAADLEEYLRLRDPSRVAALTMSWSVGSIPDREFVDGLLGVFDEAVAAGQARWGTMAEIAAAALAG